MKHKEEFTSYLQSQHLRSNTIAEELKNVIYFTAWSASENIEVEQLNHADILAYVKSMKERGLAVHTINTRLASVKKYYSYLVKEREVFDNPVGKLIIKGATRKVIEDPLKYEELEALYYDYQQYRKNIPIKEPRQQLANIRNQVVVSLLIWQGIHSGELAKIEKTGINVEEGTIQIIGTRQSNSRILKLATPQILLFYQYLRFLLTQAVHRII